jgi:hypothetical protein
MDFEYGYLNLMTNMHTFIRKAQTIYSRMESRISTIVETQTERRRIIEWNRDHNINGNLLNSHESQNLQGSTNSYVRNSSNSNSDNNDTRVEGDNHNDNENDNDDDDDDDNDDDNDGGDDNNDNIPQYVPIHPDPNNIHVNVANEANEQGNRNSTNTRNVRNMGNIDVFDFISIVPQAPLNRNTGGISIRQIEENSEIMIYSSIPSSDVLNTECPITRESFQPNSLVLRLNSCHHCFIPFRIMNWLETHSTCPLCRGTVISNPPMNDNENYENRENIGNNINNRPSTRNTSINGSDISDNYMDISNNPIDISNIYNRLLTNNIFNNLSIEDRNNNSIVFSFDLPERQDNNVNNVNYRNSYIYPRLERLFSNYNTHDASGNVNTSTNTNTNTNTNSNNNGENNGGNHNNYPNNDYEEVD